MKILAFGSNLPFENNSTKENIESAYEALSQFNINILKKSFFYQSEAYPNKSDPLFCNSAVSIDTNLSPYDLLLNILKIEKRFGRERKEKNSPRTLDIDIICFDDLIINDDDLNIPHPNLHQRPFVFLPLRDLDKSWKHPVFLKTIDEFVKEFDPNELKSVKKIL
jgi:2-amino-4-hydroxy-6-hydroxymethyldihydropteridine diphosphokinase